MANEMALVPYSDMEKMAAVMGKTNMFGKTPDQLLALMLVAQSEGIHPARAAQEYDVINGRPALKSQAALARFQEAGGSIKWIERSDTAAEADFSHPQGGTVRVRWDQAKATKAKLWGKRGREGQDTPWTTMPGIMLQWRAVAEGVRVCYPACLNRLYLVEEVQDFEPLRNVTPTEKAAQTDMEALGDVRNSKGEYSPEADPGEPATRGDRIAGKVRAIKVELGDIMATEYEGQRIFTKDDADDMNADWHPGGRDLTASQNDLDLLTKVRDKWADKRFAILAAHDELDGKQAEEQGLF
jgi:hypothetical protein